MEFQIKNVGELEKNILQLNNKIEKTKQKILAASNMEEVEEPAPKQARFTKMTFETDKELSTYLQNIRKMVIEAIFKSLTSFNMTVLEARNFDEKTHQKTAKTGYG